MKANHSKYSRASGRQILGPARERRSSTRGIALVITLILLALLGAASMAIVLLVSSDTMINGFYRNYRGSFYAADSGINVVVATMESAVYNAGADTANPPLPVGATAIPTQAQVWATMGAVTLPTGVAASYAPFQSAYYTMGDAGSWKGQFKMLIANPDGNPILGTPQFELEPAANDANSCLPTNAATCPPNGVANDHNYTWTFSYPYEVTLQGQSVGTEGEEITETGSIVYSSTSGTAAAGGPPPFSKWAAFITNFTQCQGPLAPGNMTGPFFTDGQWNFGDFSNPGYTFTGSIGQQNSQVSWWNNNSCSNSTAPPNGFKNPSFPSGGLKTSQGAVVPPSDSYNQAQAVLDGKGIPPCTVAPCPVDPAPSQTVMNAELQTIGGTAYPKTGTAPTGVYIPYYTSGTNPSGQACTTVHPCYGSNTANGGDGYAGGFYIQGNASIVLIASTGGDSTSNPTQTYKITQSGTTTTIVVDNTAGTTTVSTGGAPVTLQGVPEQLNPNDTTPTIMNQNDPSGNPVNPTLIYVNGSITGLTGNYSGNNPVAAIQDNVGVTVAASGPISITGDLTYKSLPVSVPSDAPTPTATTNSGVLGIFTNGNINLYPDPTGNLTVNGSLAALSGSQTGTSGFATPGGSITNWTIVGGRAEDQAHSVNIGSGNTYYDTRFGNNFGPPWFPTAIPQPGQAPIPASQGISVARAAWSEVTRK